MEEQLRIELVKFIKRKFASRPDICHVSEDIVNQAVVDVLSAGNTEGKMNFGYLSKVSIRIAYRYFKKYDNHKLTPYHMCLDSIAEDDLVDDILRFEDTTEILQSLQTLKDIERIVITQRYFGDLKFSEIAEKNNLNINTVLSHHRRSLNKLKLLLSGTSSTQETKPKREIKSRTKLSRLL